MTRAPESLGFYERLAWEQEQGRPRCRFERDADPSYTCGHTHCVTCGAHVVWTSKSESVLRCQMNGEACVPPLEGFA